MPRVKRKLPVPKPYGVSPDYIDQRAHEVVRNAPFQPGDIIYVERLGKARIAKVRAVRCKYHGGDIYPIYRVVMLRPDGTFNETTRWTLRITPNDVFRGYKLMNATNGY
jgi:hypothetical protein